MKRRNLFRSMPEFLLWVGGILVIIDIVRLFLQNIKKKLSSRFFMHELSPNRLSVEVVENENLIKWQSVMQMWDKEADRFWTRSNIFLIVNGALLLAITSFAEEHFLSMMISIFGMVFVMVWIKVNRIGKFYVDRWRFLLEEIETMWEDKIIGKLDQIEEYDEVASRYESSTTYMLYVLRLIFLLWIIILIFGLYQFIKQNQTFFTINCHLIFEYIWNNWNRIIRRL